jgi:hypothetical protein
MKRTALLVARTLTIGVMVLCALLAQSTNTIAVVLLPEATSIINVTAGGADPRRPEPRH